MAITNNQLGMTVSGVYNTKVGVFETGKKDAQGGAYEGVRFLALRDRKLEHYQVKDGVIIIGDRAFYDAKVKTVVLPEGLKAIGCSAFAGCKNLTGIALPEGLEVIKETAFRDCESLSVLTLPATLLYVGKRAFGPALKRLVILSENVTFDSGTFAQVKALEEILVPLSALEKYISVFKAMGVTAQVFALAEEPEIETCTVIEDYTIDNLSVLDEVDDEDQDVFEDYEEEEAIVEESTGNTTAATNKIDECANKIKGHLHELGMDEFVLYTYDYCGDLERNEDFESLDSAVCLNLYFDLHETFNGEERTFIAPRKIKVDGDDLLIDLQEVKEYNESEEEVLGYYESLSIDALLERFETSDVEKCFTEILAHTFNSDVISLNQLEEEETIVEQFNNITKMNFYEFITNVRMSYDYYDEQEYDLDDEPYQSAQFCFSLLDDDEIDRFFDILGDECDFPNEALWTMVDYDGELERDSLIDIEDEESGMKILTQYPEAFVKAAHKFLTEQEGEECEEAIYGVGGCFYWGEDDELEEEFFVEEITM